MRHQPHTIECREQDLQHQVAGKCQFKVPQMLWQVAGLAVVKSCPLACLLTQLTQLLCLTQLRKASLDIGALLTAFARPLDFEPAGVLLESHRAEEVPAI